MALRKKAFQGPAIGASPNYLVHKVTARIVEIYLIVLIVQIKAALARDGDGGQVLRADIGLLPRMPPESCPRGAVDAQMRGHLPHGVPGASAGPRNGVVSGSSEVLVQGRATPHAISSVQVIIQDKNLDSFAI